MLYFINYSLYILICTLQIINISPLCVFDQTLFFCVCEYLSKIHVLVIGVLRSELLNATYLALKCAFDLDSFGL